MSLWNKIRVAFTGENEEFAAVTGKLFSLVPTNNNSADAVVTRALDTATRVNSAGNIEVVPANKGRIDYSLGTDHCPNLLVERSKPNLLSFTENLTDIYWNKSNTTIVANTTDTLSPDGLNTADKVLDTVGTLEYRVLSGNFAATPSTTYTISGYFKKGTKSWLWFSFLEASVISSPVYYNFDTGLFGTIAAGCSVNAENVGNGWVRISITRTIGAGTTQIGYHIGMREANGQVSYTGDGTGSLYFWGGQVELGAFATSYIPRLTASAVTKNADVIQKTGISSLIPQTSGGILFDTYLQAGSLSDSVVRTPIEIATDSNNRITPSRTNNNLTVQVTNGGVSQAALSAAIINPIRNKRIKAYVEYATDNINLYVNGQLVASDTSASIPATSIVRVGGSIVANQEWDGLIREADVNEALTETEREQFFQYDSLEIMSSELQYVYES